MLDHHLHRCTSGSANKMILFTKLLLPLLQLLLLLLLMADSVSGVAPTIDYSHNMRILKLPKSVRPGELVYRLKGSDGDPSSQLRFGVSGIEGRALLDVVQVPNSWNEADVFLRSSLLAAGATSDSSSILSSSFQQQQQQQQQLPAYNLTVFVSDGNKTTQVESTLIVTDDDELVEPAAAAPPTRHIGNRTAFEFNITSNRLPPASVASHTHLLSPFLRPRHVFSVPENTAPGESIGSLTVRESDKSDLPVRFELRGPGAEHFAIKYVFGPRGQSRAELVLAQPVDYEQQNLFTLKVLALNAWTDTRFDTRNVATLDIVISVGDVQDTAPKWRELPHLLRVPNTGQPGDLLGRVLADDADFGDQRQVQYALDANSPLLNYFSIDTKTGAIKLAKAAQELALAFDGAATSLPQLVVYASELADTRSYEHLWPPMFARTELPIQLVDQANEPPRFIGGWQTPASPTAGPPLALAGVPSTILHGFLREFTHHQHQQQQTNEDISQQTAGSVPSSQLVQWYANSSAGAADLADLPLLSKWRGRPMIIDLGLGANGTFELALEGPDAALFELEPDYPVSRQTLFNLQVSSGVNRSMFDADQVRGGGDSPRVFQVDVVARDFGSPSRLSSRIRCLIELLDVDDNAPQFESDLYTFQVYENAPPGQVLGSIRARDPDAGKLAIGSSQRVRYVSLTGLDSHLFKLDQEDGLITLAGSLDRERQSHYLLVAEARDASGGLATNYTKILINVLDVNDNAPVFSQSHYDAMLLADGTFHQPLVVSASDADEPHSANSQVAYEIIAGNQNDQFAIDSLSGAIYPTGMAPPSSSPGLSSGGSSLSGAPPSTRSPNTQLQLPSILSDPILPFGRPAEPPLDQHGKIRPAPTHEVEETTVPSRNAAGASLSNPLRLNWPRQVDVRDARMAPSAHQAGQSTPSLPEHPMSLFEQLPELLMSVDAQDHRSANRHVARSVGSPPTPSSSDTSPLYRGGQGSFAGPAAPTAFDPFKVAPLTTLVVRAHDFGIPLRSATCKVNIYNQALQSRSISVILNGTAEQLDQRRELIERAFGALTASKAQIESIDALSDSSSICVARIRLAIPAGHSLIDLTDLSSLMQALDYKPASQQQAGDHQLQFRQPGTHFIAAGDRLYPVQSSAGLVPLSNISSAPPGTPGSTQNNYLPAFYTDINQLSLESNMLERKLLFYIIVVGICILALLVIWMIYFCCRESDHERHQAKLEDHEANLRGRRHHSTDSGRDERNSKTKSARSYKQKTSSKTQLIEEEEADENEATNEADSKQTQAKSTTAIGTQLSKQQLQQQQQQPNGNNNNNNNAQNFLSPAGKPSDRYSMYNGQVWFEQGGLTRAKLPTASAGIVRPQVTERRASSAPSASANSLDSSLRAAIQGRSPGLLSPANSSIMLMPMGAQSRSAQGQFFPNTLGYMENLNAIEDTQRSRGGFFGHKSSTGRRHQHGRSGKVVPMSLLNAGQTGHLNGAFNGADIESGAGLVLVPANSLTVAKELRRAHGSQHGQHSSSAGRKRGPDGGESVSSTRSTSCTSSTSGATQTLGAESHESVVLDSDQELLGFDSTGTPIIATRTRRTEAESSARSLLSEVSPPIGGGSVTPTYIKHQSPIKNLLVSGPSANNANFSNQTSTNDDKKSNDKTREPPPEDTSGSKENQNKTISKQSAAEDSVQGIEREEKKSESSKNELQKGNGARREPQTTANINTEQSGRKCSGSPGQAVSSDGGAKGGKSLDLMGELNEKLSGPLARQRALRRQSADEQDSSSTAARAQTSGKQQMDTTATTSGNQRRRASGHSLSYQSSISSVETTIASGGEPNGTANNKTGSKLAAEMKNGELLEKQSIFALTYSGLATDKLPS